MKSDGQTRVLPLAKKSKKAQRAYHKLRRGDWNGVVPVTRVVPDKKKYDRKKKYDMEE